MPSECAHATCSNLLVKGNNISFHRFPKDPVRRRRWTFLMRRHEGWSPQPWDLVCGKHFRSQDFDRTGQTVRLRNGVEPSIFDIPKHLPKTTKPRQTLNSTKSQAVDSDDEHDDGTSVDEVEVEIDFDEDTCFETATSAEVVQSFHTYAGNEESFKEKWLRAERRADEAERKLRNILQREKRTKLTVKNLIEDLKEKNILTDELQSKLDGYAGT